MSPVRSTSYRTGNARRNLGHKLRAQIRTADSTVHDEDEYERDVPTMSISKVFVVILLLHVVVLFGLIVMHWSKKAGDPTAAADAAVAPASSGGGLAPAPGVPALTAAAGQGDAEASGNQGENSGALAPVIVPEGAPLAPPGRSYGDIPAGWATHTVAGSEQMPDIARHTGVEQRWLEKANRELGRTEIRPGAVLAVPPASVVEEWEIDARVASARPAATAETNPAPVSAAAGSTAAAEPAASAVAAAPATRPTETPVEEEPVIAAAAASPAAEAEPEVALAAVEPEKVEPVAETVVEEEEPEAPASSGGNHTVKKGETFYRIARDHNVSVDELMKANGYSDASGLQIGATLRIP